MAETKLDLGPIQKLMDDADISEIMVNEYGKVFVEKFGKKVLTDVKLNDNKEVLDLSQRIFNAMGKRLDSDLPYMDVCLDDGSRVNAIIPPLSRFGAAQTIRKFSKRINSLEDLIKLDSLSQKAADFLVACIKGRLNILFSGGTGTGKTTLMQLLSSYIAEDERIVTIEDTAELKLAQENIVSLETRPSDRDGKGEITIRDLIRNSLRMAPDRIIIGEIRGEEAIDMLQAMATGHSGTLGIIHGNSPREVIARLETMMLMSGINLPLDEIKKQIYTTINIIVHIERFSDGTRKVSHITELRGFEKGAVVFNDLFLYQADSINDQGHIIGKLKPVLRNYPLFYQKFLRKGLINDKVFVSE